MKCFQKLGLYSDIPFLITTSFFKLTTKATQAAECKTGIFSSTATFSERQNTQFILTLFNDAISTAVIIYYASEMYQITALTTRVRKQTEDFEL